MKSRASNNNHGSAAERRETRWLLVTWIASTLALFGGVALWHATTDSENGGWIWTQILGLATVPGKSIIFSGLAPKSPLGPWGLAMLSVAVDLVVGLALAVGLAPLRHVPLVGPALKRVNESARAVMREYRRLRRMSFWGVALFVALPLPASGAVGGTFAGQFLGLSRTMGLLAILLGGALQSVVFASLAEEMGAQAQALLDNPWITAAGALVFAVALYFVWRRMRALLRG